MKIYTVRIVYKSGYTHDFEVTEFSIKGRGEYEWVAYDDMNKPVKIGPDDIAAVWQVGVREAEDVKNS